MSDDIPSLTLRVLQNIQGDLQNIQGDLQSIRGELVSMNTKFDILNEKVDTLDRRFDNFLTFVGSDVQDLKIRVTALEAKRKPRS